MLQYRKRNRPEEAGKVPALEESELVLRLRREELFDPHVLLPHAEMNAVVYASVDQFVNKYKGKDLTLSIFCEPLNEAVQNTFREVYRAHYEDEHQKINRYLKRRYHRVIALLIFSIGAFSLWSFLNGHGAVSDIILNIITNSGAFCLWEVGYTQFSRKDAMDERARIERARDAVIEFHKT